MSDSFFIGAAPVFGFIFALLGGWLARNHPFPAFRVVAAVMSTIAVSTWSMEFGCRLSNLRGPWVESQGYSCGEAKVIGLVLIPGGVFLIRAVWLSIRAEVGEVARATKLALACLGLALVGFTLSESGEAHDKFHRVQPPSAGPRASGVTRGDDDRRRVPRPARVPACDEVPPC